MVTTWKPVRVVIDEERIAATNDPMEIIEPVWCLVDFHEDPASYDASLRRFSRSQRYVWAALWYDAEVCNGGHHQFYSNPTGMVWRDALEAFGQMEMAAVAAIIDASAARLGSAPSSSRVERNRQLSNFRGTFDDLDDRYYAFMRENNLNAKIMTFIRKQPQDFAFSGTIQKPFN